MTQPSQTGQSQSWQPQFTNQFRGQIPNMASYVSNKLKGTGISVPEDKLTTVLNDYVQESMGGSSSTPR